MYFIFTGVAAVVALMGAVRGWATADPQVSKLKRVADFFGCTVDDLLKK